MEAGFVGRPHGLDGSFHLNLAKPRLLALGTFVWVSGRVREVVRLAGTDAKPIVRLEGVADRDAAQALRGQALTVVAQDAPALEPDEYWAHDLEGCLVLDGEREVGVVRRLMGLPSCEVLEVVRPDGRELLVPMVRDAIREVDVPGRRIQVNLTFLAADA